MNTYSIEELTLAGKAKYLSELLNESALIAGDYGALIKQAKTEFNKHHSGLSGILDRLNLERASDVLGAEEMLRALARAVPRDIYKLEVVKEFRGEIEWDTDCTGAMRMLNEVAEDLGDRAELAQYFLDILSGQKTAEFPVYGL